MHENNSADDAIKIMWILSIIGEKILLQIGFLEEHNFRLIVPDLRGFGESSKPEGTEHYSSEQLTQDIIALLDALAIDKCGPFLATKFFHVPKNENFHIRHHVV